MTVFTILADTSTPANFDGTTLPKLQFGDTIVSFAGHHVIPQDLFNSSQLFAELKSGNLFNPNSFAQNGLPLPSTPAGAATSGMAYHAGGHPARVARNKSAECRVQ